MKHQVDHGDVNHGQTTVGHGFVVLAQAAILSQPRKRSLDNPPLRQNFKCGRRLSLDQFDHATERLLGHPHEFTGVSAIGPDEFEPAESTSRAYKFHAASLPE